MIIIIDMFVDAIYCYKNVLIQNCKLNIYYMIYLQIEL